MTLTKVAKWASVSLLVGVIVLVVWSYVNARQHGRLPVSHPWPAVSLIGGAASSFLIGSGKNAKTGAVFRLIVIAAFTAAALFYLAALR